MTTGRLKRRAESVGRLWADSRLLVRRAWAIDRRRFITQIWLLAVLAIVGGAGMMILIPIVNSLASGTQSIAVRGLGTIDVSEVPLWALLAAFVALVALQAWVTRASTLNSAVLQQRIVDSMRQDAFGAILAAKWAFVLTLRRSDIIQTVTVGANRAGAAVQQLVQASVAMVLVVVTAAITIVVAPLVGAVALLVVLVLLLLQVNRLTDTHRLGGMVTSSSRHLQRVMTDSLDSLRLIRAHNSAPVWVDRIAGAFTEARDAQYASTERMSAASAASSVGTAALVAGLVLLGTWAQVSPASIVVLVLLMSRISGQSQMALRALAQVANSLPAVRDLQELTDEAHAAVEVPPGPTSERRESRAMPGVPLLEFRAVTYTYPNSGRGVGDLSFVVPTGDITVLTGPSGAGKSTAADLALGLLEPDAGEVLVRGIPLLPEDLAWWRSHVAYVPQETVLVPGSLRDNLTWSVPDEVTDEDCWAALERAAATFVAGLDDGLDTQVGDRGARLSGGERQRVAIARALLRDPLLLVLDEATSSLDDVAEAAVLRTVTTLAPEVTVLVIAHRMSTVEAAHHVIRIEEGRVALPSPPEGSAEQIDSKTTNRA